MAIETLFFHSSLYRNWKIISSSSIYWFLLIFVITYLCVSWWIFQQRINNARPYNFVTRDFYQSNNLPLVPSRLSTAISTGCLARYRPLSLCATCTHVERHSLHRYSITCSKLTLTIIIREASSEKTDFPLSDPNCCLSPRRYRRIPPIRQFSN